VLVVLVKAADSTNNVRWKLDMGKNTPQIFMVKTRKSRVKVEQYNGPRCVVKTDLKTMHINIDYVGSDQPLPEEASLMIFDEIVRQFLDLSPEEVSYKPVPTTNNG
jgi:hypothetical protein